ncbi:endoplasmic reticulum mannosyl-oligosaccharide 1,2-alpha-mannosidase [Phlebotomus papatasi]|uniref:endoplasmic reticulum mannosyl-oligosaccharide 1,2-alpha-mannosidase n=1 Tax=Phlebotomus papatasi TaxID=29031 RepID=UPI002483ABC2|nr:endoplasmic reticulum mannosyl-oligosaccharide 1,2-alpha-mannosidase [Phlebotomus papatasi]
MLKLNRDHISLLLPTSGQDSTGTSSRKSLRRTWNQLSRFQRNIIFTVILAFFIMSFVLYSGLGDGHTEKTGHAGNRREQREVERPVREEVGAIEVILRPPDDADEASEIEPERTHRAEMDNPPTMAPAKAPTEEGPKVFSGPRNERQIAVVKAFQHAWSNYRTFAWGHDNLKPISQTHHDWFGLGLTIVDALDTMYIMNLRQEFDEARQWVDTGLSFEVNRDVNLFEVTIRVLGGLLSAYHLSGDQMFLVKAADLGNRLLPCFESQSGIPYSDVNLATLRAHSPKWSPDSSTSEVTTIQLEFRDLSRSTGDDIYEAVAHKVNEKIHSLEKRHGLVPIFINANTGMFRTFSTISLGARADSYYEYLLKQWLQTGKKDDDFLVDDYRVAIEGVIGELVRETPNEHHVYIGELINGKEFKPKMDHLTCYLPGTLLLGYKHGMPESHLKLAKDLLETCFQTYMKQPTQLAPEITYFNLHGESEKDIYVKSNDAHNLLRPEFIESLYYFYVITGNKTYQDMGWTIFNAFERHTRVKNGYTSIGNVKNVLNTRPRDMMESFFLGETLKYFYLLFSDDRKEIDIDQYVFNSEAHPLPIRSH